MRRRVSDNDRTVVYETKTGAAAKAKPVADVDAMRGGQRYRHGALGSRPASSVACLLVALALASTMAKSVRAQNVSLLRDAQVATYFSPHGGAEQARADLIDSAQRRVWVAGYGFTSEAIANALLAAHRRGVDVQVVIDKSNVYARHSRGAELKAAGIDVRSHHAYAIMHHKFVVVDDRVAFGSMNASDSGETRNAENWNIFSNAGPLTRVYANEFARLHAGARVFEDRSAESRRAAPGNAREDDSAAERVNERVQESVTAASAMPPPGAACQKRCSRPTAAAI